MENFQFPGGTQFHLPEFEGFSNPSSPFSFTGSPEPQASPPPPAALAALGGLEWA